jgi:NitT/TauT family transport system substrate-binding protein
LAILQRSGERDDLPGWEVGRTWLLTKAVLRWLEASLFPSPPRAERAGTRASTAYCATAVRWVVLKTADLCVSEPERIARWLVYRRFGDRYDYALDTLRSIPYSWRNYNPEDSLRFYFLRMHKRGLIKSNPDKLIANGTDWRFLNELKSELKA